MAMRHESGRSRPHALSGDELADCADQFDQCDTDGDGRIDFTEFTQLLENLGSEVAPAHRRARFDAIDTDRDGAIRQGEFVQWWQGL